MSITDHDTVSNYQEILDYAQDFDITIIKGIEISTQYENKSIHILAYFNSLDKFFELKKLEEKIKLSRVARIHKICENLIQENIHINAEEIIAKAGTTIGRPHIARELVEKDYVKTEEEAFNKYLGDSMRYYIPSSFSPTLEILEYLKELGGVSVLAHPKANFIQKEPLIKTFIDHGLQGIEVYYPGHDYFKWNYYLKLCRKYDLLATGGSDFHGSKYPRGDFLGKLKIPEGEYLRFSARLASI